MTTPTQYALAAARANTAAARARHTHHHTGGNTMTTPTTPTPCDHKWRYSNTRDTFYCRFCFMTESPDTPTTTPEATQ